MIYEITVMGIKVELTDKNAGEILKQVFANDVLSKTLAYIDDERHLEPGTPETVKALGEKLWTDKKLQKAFADSVVKRYRQKLGLPAKDDNVIPSLSGLVIKLDKELKKEIEKKEDDFIREALLAYAETHAEDLT